MQDPPETKPTLTQPSVPDLDGLDWMLTFVDPKDWESIGKRYESFVTGRAVGRAITAIVRSGFPRGRLIFRYAMLVQAIKQFYAVVPAVPPEKGKGMRYFPSVEWGNQCVTLSRKAARFADELEKHWKNSILPPTGWKVPPALKAKLEIAAGIPNF